MNNKDVGTLQYFRASAMGLCVHTTSSMIHLMPEPKPLLFCSSELCGVCVRDSSYASIFKVRYKNENNKMAEKPFVGFQTL